LNREEDIKINNINKAEEIYGVILAAGNGSRLGYPNELGGKAMVKLNGKPLLYYAVNKLTEVGIKKIAVVANPQNLQPIRNYFGKGEKFNVEITFIIQEKPLGIAHALSLCKNFTANHNLALLLVDNIFEVSLKNSLAAFIENPVKAMVFLTEVENPSVFGVAKLEGSQITEIWEKPQNPPSNWVVIGFYLYDPGVYDIITTLSPSARGELEITDVNKAYLAMGKLSYAKLEGWWLDIGTRENQIKGEKLLNKGN
jgi:glucose-1-phosphate thymidylyltransferase